MGWGRDIGVGISRTRQAALHRTALHRTALHCTALHCTALHCTAMQCTAVHCTAMHCTALHRAALHCIAVHCTALQRNLLEAVRRCARNAHRFKRERLFGTAQPLRSVAKPLGERSALRAGWWCAGNSQKQQPSGVPRCARKGMVNKNLTETASAVLAVSWGGY